MLPSQSGLDANQIWHIYWGDNEQESGWLRMLFLCGAHIFSPVAIKGQAQSTHKVPGQEEHSNLIGSDHQLSLLLLQGSPGSLGQVGTDTTRVHNVIT